MGPSSTFLDRFDSVLLPFFIRLSFSLPLIPSHPFLFFTIQTSNRPMLSQIAAQYIDNLDDVEVVLDYLAILKEERAAATDPGE